MQNIARGPRSTARAAIDLLFRPGFFASLSNPFLLHHLPQPPVLPDTWLVCQNAYK